MPTLRTTWEAKRQLVDLLVQSGIPEECMVPQCFNFTGPDPKLDMLVALIAMGTYPNVCMHKEKRKVLTTGKFIFHVRYRVVNTDWPYSRQLLWLFSLFSEQVGFVRCFLKSLLALVKKCHSNCLELSQSILITLYLKWRHT